MMFWIHWSVQNSPADGIAAALIVVGSLGYPLLAAALQTKQLLCIERLSYSLYLIFGPLVFTIMIGFYGHVPLLGFLLTAVLCSTVAGLFGWNVQARSARLTAGWMTKPPQGESEQYAKPQAVING